MNNIKVTIELPDTVSNDSTYTCPQCEDIVVCFTSSGTTNFCPNFGNREVSEDEDE